MYSALLLLLTGRLKKKLQSNCELTNLLYLVVVKVLLGHLKNGSSPFDRSA